MGWHAAASEPNQYRLPNVAAHKCLCYRRLGGGPMALGIERNHLKPAQAAARHLAMR